MSSKRARPRPAAARLAWAGGCAVLLLAGPALACRYNVRDLGFIARGGESYRLIGCGRSNTPPAWREAFRRATGSLGPDANLESQWVDLDSPEVPPPLRELTAALPATVSGAVLVSPEERIRPLALPWGQDTGDRELGTWLESLLISPKRREIAERASQDYGVILLIEGTDAEATARARRAAEDAVRQIAGQLRSLPKPIAHPPALVTLEAGALAAERILLWSLGLDPQPEAEPRAAILYGRARWIGPSMRGLEIAERNLAGILGFVGADCECGLDMAWTRGTPVPLRWDAAWHARAAKSLGFDPEDPLVRLEADRILSRSLPRAADGGSGYREVEVEGPARAAGASPAHTAAPASPPARTAGNRAALAQARVPPRWPWFAAAAAAGAVLLAGGWQLWRKSRAARDR